MTRDERIGVLQAVAAASLFSTGAILIRWAQEMSPVEITSLRMLLGGGLVAAATRATGTRLRLPAADVRRLIPIGLIAAVHFLTFIASLSASSATPAQQPAGVARIAILSPGVTQSVLIRADRAIK